MIYKPIALLAAALCVAMLPAGAATADDTLVGNVFSTAYDGWTDTNTWRLTPEANWGVLLTDTKNLIETSNTILGLPGVTVPPTGAALAQCDVWKMVNLNYSTPSDYTLSAKIGSWDDDGFGLIFGYQDEGNYFRVSCRAQNADSFGYPRGVSVQKVTTVGGVTTFTNLAQNTAIRSSIPCLGGTPPSTNGGAMFDLQVVVSGNSYTVNGNFTTSTPAATMTTYCSGTDPDLPSLAAGHYGVQSWAQYQGGSGTKRRGTEVQSVTVASDSFNKTHTFADAMPVDWRLVKMTNANGIKDTGNDGDGNFRQAFPTGTICDDSNSYEWATTAAANVDFIGQAVVVDEPGNASWTDYEMTVRVSCIDNEGPGVLVRVQDDETFYRINFAAEAMGTGTTRAPQGLSIQKCDGRAEGNPIWTQLFRDSQTSPKFVYGNGASVRPFDLKVRVVGNQIKVQVIDDPDGTPTVIDYDPVVDGNNPILAGSVGLTNWGGGDAASGPVFSAYGGVAGHALLIAIPEPSTLVLLGLLAVGGLGARRRG